MKVSCSHCGHEARLPAGKIPDKPFSFACPSCKKKVRVDPAEQEPEVEAVAFEPLPPISPRETELVASCDSLAFLVKLDDHPVQLLEDGLRLLGISLVQRYQSLEDAVEAFAEAIPALVVVRMSKVPPPPCEPLRPLLALAPQDRRRTVVALVGENVRSLDGQTAFFLQVNALIGAQDLSRFPHMLRRAWLYHLGRYRFWKGDLGAE